MCQFIIWDVNPELVNLFGVYSIRYYSLLFLIGFLLAYWKVYHLFKKEGRATDQLEQLATYSMLGIIVGARLGHCLLYEPAYYLNHPLEMLLPFQMNADGLEWTGYLGLASHGGAIGVFIAIVLFVHKTQINLLTLLDRIALAVPITGIFIRIGNFMNSEIIGVSTHSNYGVIFKRVDLIPRHPAQLYEAFAYFLLFLFLNRFYQNRKSKDGFVFGLFLSLLFTIRFLIEFYKENQVAAEAGILLNFGQLYSIPFIVAGILIMMFSTYKN